MIGVCSTNHTNSYREAMFYHVNVFKSKRDGYLCTNSCCHSDTKINAGEYFQLLEKDEIACLHAESTWLSEAVRHHLSVKCLFLWQPLFWGPVGRGHCPPSTPHCLPAWLILSRRSARKAVWITVSSPSLSLPSKMKGHFSPSHRDSPQDVSLQKRGMLPRLPPTSS